MSALRVLVVEDDPVSNFETCTALRDRGFAVLGVDCGAAALHVIATGIPLAALATDIDLGKGADGFAVAHHARLAYPRLPVVYISGTAAARHRAEGVEGSEFVRKPFDPQQVIDAVERLLIYPGKELPPRFGR